MKKLEPGRCPWCGKVCDYERREKGKWNREVYISSCCKKPMKLIVFSGKMIWVILLCMIVQIVWVGDEIGRVRSGGVVLIPFIIYGFLNAKKMPFKRYKLKGQENQVSTKGKKIGRANVVWYKVRQGGIEYPYIRILSNMIFPVCFVNAEGTPVSQTVCVRLQKRFLYFWRNAGVRLITEDLWKADADGKVPWEKAEKFLIFNCGEVIGEGRIK